MDRGTPSKTKRASSFTDKSVRCGVFIWLLASISVISYLCVYAIIKTYGTATLSLYFTQCNAYSRCTIRD